MKHDDTIRLFHKLLQWLSHRQSEVWIFYVVESRSLRVSVECMPGWMYVDSDYPLTFSQLKQLIDGWDNQR